MAAKFYMKSSTYALCKIIFCILLWAGLLIIVFKRDSYSLGYTVDTIEVRSYYIEDFGTSGVIVEKNKEKIYPAASTVKLVTAMVAKKMLKRKEIIRIPRKAARIEPAKANLRQGERYFAKDLIYAMIIKSANDAAMAVALHIGGTEKKFTALMNKWCKEMGILNTYMDDSTGLSPESVSTAEDLSKIFKLFIKDSENKKMLRRRHYRFRSLSGRRVRVAASNNFHIYRNELGGKLIGKTGFTKRAKYCFAGLVTYGKFNYYIVVMGAGMAWHQVAVLMNYANEYYLEKKFSEPF